MDDGRASPARRSRSLKNDARDRCTDTLEIPSRFLRHVAHEDRSCESAFPEGRREDGSSFSVNMFSRSTKRPVGSQRQLITFRRIIYRDSLAPPKANPLAFSSAQRPLASCARDPRRRHPVTEHCSSPRPVTDPIFNTVSSLGLCRCRFYSATSS